MAKRKWNEDEIAILERMYADRVPKRLIAKEFNCTKHDIDNQLIKYNLREKYGRTIEPYRNGTAFKQNPNPVTRTTWLLVCTSYFEGNDMDEVSKMLGRTPETIDKIIRKCKKNGYYSFINGGVKDVL